MKYLKLYENFDFDDEDFDFEEEYPNYKSKLLDKGFTQFLMDNNVYDKFIEEYKPINPYFRNSPMNEFLDKLKQRDVRSEYLFFAFSREIFTKHWVKIDRNWVNNNKTKYNY